MRATSQVRDRSIQGAGPRRAPCLALRRQPACQAGSTPDADLVAGIRDRTLAGRIRDGWIVLFRNRCLCTNLAVKAAVPPAIATVLQLPTVIVWLVWAYAQLLSYSVLLTSLSRQAAREQHSYDQILYLSLERVPLHLITFLRALACLAGGWLPLYCLNVLQVWCGGAVPLALAVHTIWWVSLVSFAPVIATTGHDEYADPLEVSSQVFFECPVEMVVGTLVQSQPLLLVGACSAAVVGPLVAASSPLPACLLLCALLALGNGVGFLPTIHAYLQYVDTTVRTGPPGWLFPAGAAPAEPDASHSIRTTLVHGSDEFPARSRTTRVITW